MDFTLQVGETRTFRARSLVQGAEAPFSGQASWNSWGPPGIITYTSHYDTFTVTAQKEGVAVCDLNVYTGQWPAWKQYRFGFNIHVGKPASEIDVALIPEVTPNSYAPIMSPG